MQKKKAGGAAAGGGAAEEEECPICLDRLQGAVCTLPCNHRFHASCIEQVRNFGLQQVCPMCREELPPDADTMGFDGYRLYCPVQKRVERADDSWGPLSRGGSLTYTVRNVLKYTLGRSQGLVRWGDFPWSDFRWETGFGVISVPRV